MHVSKKGNSTNETSGIGTFLLGSALSLFSADTALSQTPESTEPVPAVAANEEPALVLTAPLVNQPQGIRLLDGSFLEGQLTSIKDRAVIVGTSQGEQTIPFNTILEAVIQGEPQLVSPPPAQLIMFDGTVARGSTVRFERSSIQLGAETEEESLNLSKTVRFATAKAFFTRAIPLEFERELQRVLDDEKRDSDCVVLLKIDPPALDFLDCFVGDFTADAVTVGIGEETVTAPLKTKSREIVGVVFANRREAISAADDAIYVHTTRGETLVAESLTLENDSVRIDLADGNASVTRPLDTITTVDLSRDKVFSMNRLSIKTLTLPQADLMAGRQVQAPRFDTALDGRMLTVGDTEFDSGFSIQSGTSIEFRLPAGVNTFEACAGIADATRSTGSVHLRLYDPHADDKTPLLSQPIEAATGSVEIKVALNGARRLRVEVDPGPNRFPGDALHLGGAQVRK